MSSRRLDLVAIAVLVALLGATYGNVIFGGASLVYSDNYNPLDERLLAQNYGPDLVPESEWTKQNLLQQANLHDPGATWWQWEPGGEFLRRSMERRDWPWWDPFVAGGAPAMANLTQSFFFPPYLLVVALGNTSLLRNLYSLAVILSAGLGSYLLLRRHGLSRPAATAGAVAVMSCGGLNQNAGSFIGQTAAGLPLALLLTRYFLESPTWRRTAALAGGYAVLALASFPPLLLATFGVCALYALAWTAVSSERAHRGLRFAIAAALGMLLVAFCYLPAMVAARAPQFGQTYAGAGLTAVPWKLLTELLSPVLVGGTKVLANPPWPDRFPISVPYVGVLTLFFAGLASPPARRDARVLFVVVATGAALIVAKLIGLEPVQSIGRIPGLSTIHFAHYFGIPLDVLLGLGAGFGMESLLSGRTSTWRVLAGAGLLAAVLLAMPALALERNVFAHPFAGYWLARWYLLVGLLAGAAVAASVLAWKGGSRSSAARAWCIAGLVVLALFECVTNNRYPRQHRADVWRHPPPYVRALIQNASLGRIYGLAVFTSNAGSALGVRQLDSMMAFNPERVFRLYQRYAEPTAYLFLRNARQLPPEAVLDAANIGLVAVREVHQSLVAEVQARRYRQIFADDFARVFARPTEPHYYFTSSYKLVGAEGALDGVARRAAREVLLEQAPGWPSSPNGGVEVPIIARAGANRVLLRLNAPRDGLVYLSDSFADGWRARVNGRAVPILAANYAFRAVAVEPGRVEVELEYFPPGLQSGLALSLLGAIGCVLVALRREAESPVLSEAAPPRWPARRVAAWCTVVASVTFVLYVVVQDDTLRRTAQGSEDGADFYRVEWGAVHLPPRLSAGARVRTAVRFRNASDQPWLDPRTADPPRAFGWGAVRLSYRWLDGGGELVSDYASRTDLKRPLPPGDWVTVPVELLLPPRPGRYELQIDLVHELQAWFADRGAEPLTKTVVVDPSAIPAPRPRQPPAR